MRMTPTRHGTSYPPSVYPFDVLGTEGTDRPHRVHAIPLRPLKVNQARVTVYQGNRQDQILRIDTQIFEL